MTPATPDPGPISGPRAGLLRSFIGTMAAGILAAILLSGWGAGRMSLALPAYRIEPGRALDLFGTALLWYLPLAVALTFACLGVATIVRSARGSGPGEPAPGAAALHVGAGTAACVAFFGFGLLVRGAGAEVPATLPGLPALLLLAAAAAAAGHGAASVTRAARRSRDVARRIRGASILSVGAALALIVWSLLRELLGVAARSPGGVAMAAASLAAGLSVSWGLVVLLSAALRIWRRLLAMAVALLAVGAAWVMIGSGRGAPAAGEADRRRSPNVLMIVADTLRADRVGAYGSTRATTPHLDDLARRGALFSEAAAVASWTLPTTATIMTGLEPAAHGLRTHRDTLRKEAVGLAKRFQRAGYATGGIVANPILTRELGFARGFDHYDEGLSDDLVSSHPRSTLAFTLSALGLRQPREIFPRAEEVVERALSWLRGVVDRPFFLYLHLMDPHDPYAPPPPWDSLYGRKPGEDLELRFGDVPRIAAGTLEVVPADFTSMVALYDGAVSYMDDQVGALLASMRAMDLLENTLVVFVSDHGEELLDHGGLLHEHTLYEELVRIPLIIAGPGVTPGAVLDGPVSQVDLAPTVLEAAGLTPPAPMPGISLWGALARSEPLPLRDIHMEEVYIGLRSSVHALRAVRRGPLKLIGSAFDPGGEGPWQWELFDLDSDPGETINLIASRPAEAGELRRVVEAWAARAGAPGRGRETPGEELDRLKTLGYIE